MISYVSNDDPTRRGLFEEILSFEEEHANDLLELKKEFANNIYKDLIVTRKLF